MLDFCDLVLAVVYYSISSFISNRKTPFIGYGFSHKRKVDVMLWGKCDT